MDQDTKPHLKPTGSQTRGQSAGGISWADRIRCHRPSTCSGKHTHIQWSSTEVIVVASVLAQVQYIAAGKQLTPTPCTSVAIMPHVYTCTCTCTCIYSEKYYSGSLLNKQWTQQTLPCLYMHTWALWPSPKFFDRPHCASP